MKPLFAASLLSASLGLAAQAFAMGGETLKIYGPGGPAPAMKELAATFEAETGTKVEVTAGPLPKWADAAQADADIIYSGSENMMTGFSRKFPMIDEATVEPLYIRPSTILVRPGNPKGITGIHDIAKPGINIMVVGGAGQVGMWEDVATRTGDIALLAGFRANIAENAVNSGKALEAWKARPEIDAWLIWTHWEIAQDDLADQVPVEPELQIWRPMDVGLTQAGKSKDSAQKFLALLKSDEGRAVFEKWGWSAGQ